jgi:hypothetical protein
MSTAASVAPTSAWESVEYTLRKHYHNPDLQAARAVYAAAAIHHYGVRPPVWLMLIAPPGSMKTQLLDALTGAPRVHPVDMLTKNTFLSGQIATGRNRPSSSFLHRIGPSGIITFADFSTIIGMRWDDCNTIFAQMRRIYDGRINREYGTNEGDTEWTGHITFLAACTNSVERFQQQMKGLGERFTQVVLPRGSRRAAIAAITQDKGACTSELRQAVQKLLQSLPASAPGILESHHDRIASLAEFISFARTPIHRDRNKNIIAMSEIETPTRLSEVLVNLGKGSAALDGRDTINESDFDLMVRVAFDCIPEARRAYLRYLIGNRKEMLIVRGSLLTYTIEELKELGVACDGVLTEEFQRLLDEARVTTYNCRRPADQKGLLSGFTQ